MEEKKLRIKNILGLAARIAVSFVIIAVIFWKYDELKNIDVRALVDASESFAVAVISILGATNFIFLRKYETFVILMVGFLLRAETWFSPICGMCALFSF